MSDLTFLDSLDEEQRANLNKVIDSAVANGVDPRLAASLAYTESKLRQMKGKDVLMGGAGEVGIMQIKPNTAKLVGFDADQIKQTDQNIDAGMKYLKQSLDKFKDPVLGAIGYNAGPDHKFFTSGGEAPPPDQSVNYVNQIQLYGGFTPTVSDEKAEESNRGDFNEFGPLPKAEVTPASEEDFRTQQAAMMGAGAGAGVGTLQKGYQATVGGPSGGAPAGGPAGGTAGEKWAQKVTGYVKPGVQTVTEAATDYRRAMPQGKVSGPLAKRFGVAAPGEPAGLVDRLIERQNRPPPVAPVPTTGQNVRAGLQQFGGAMARSPIVSGALAGAGAAGGAQEAQTRFANKDTLGGGIAAAGAIGSGMSMIPTLPTRVLGTGLAMSSPAALMVLDKMREAQKQPKVPPSPEELETAKRAAFGMYPRP